MVYNMSLLMTPIPGQRQYTRTIPELSEHQKGGRDSAENMNSTCTALLVKGFANLNNLLPLYGMLNV